MISARAVCLPAGVTLDGTRAVSTQRQYAPLAGGGLVPILTEVYARGDAPVVILYWVSVHGRTLLAAVDDHPADQTPAWIDAGIVRDDGQIAPEAVQACRWHRIMRHLHPEAL